MVTPMVGTKAHQMAIFTLGNGILASTIKAGGGTHFHYTQVIFVLQHLTTKEKVKAVTGGPAAPVKAGKVTEK